MATNAEKAAAEKAAAEKAAAEKAAASEKAIAKKNAKKHPLPDPKAKRTKIMIHRSELETGDVYLSINGHPYLIQREKEVSVPDEVMEALNNAVINTSINIDKKIIPQTIRRYSYSVVK